MTRIKLAGPAKIGGKCYREGETVEVDEDTAAGLAVMGLAAKEVTELTAAPGVDLRQVDLAALPAGQNLVTMTEEQFAEAVARQAKALADSVSDAVIEAACADIIGERDRAVEGVETLNRRVEELLTELAAEQMAHQETRRQLEAAQAQDHTDTPPSETPAETAPKKKGAVGTTKG